jgi:hypothetical protein
MAKRIADNKNKHRLLLTMMHQPRRFFSMKELSLRTTAPLKRVKNQLQHLAKQRLVTHADKFKERFWRINQGAATYEEMKKLLAPELKSRQKSKTRDMIERLVLSCGDVRFAALSGVFIGQNKAPIDLLLVGEISPLRAERLIQLLQRIMSVEINYALFTEREYKSRLYSFDWFLKEILERDPLILVDKVRGEHRIGKTDRFLRSVYTRVE